MVGSWCDKVFYEKKHICSCILHGNRYPGVNKLKTSSVIVVYPPTSTLETPRWKKSNTLYRYCTSKKFLEYY